MPRFKYKFPWPRRDHLPFKLEEVIEHNLCLIIFLTSHLNTKISAEDNDWFMALLVWVFTFNSILVPLQIPDVIVASSLGDIIIALPIQSNLF